MKRSDRGRYRSVSRGRHTAQNTISEGQKLYILLALILIGVGCWYLYQHRDAFSLPKEEEESSISQAEPSQEAAAETEAQAVRPKGEPVNIGTVYRIYEGTMETSEGTYSLSDGFSVYTLEGHIEWENLNSLIGMEDVSLYLDEEGLASSIYIPEAVMSPAKIRILLSNPGGGYYFSEPTVTCSTDYWTTVGDAIETHRSDESFVPSGDGRIVLKGADENTVWSVAGGEFRGTLELVPDESGWYIVNMLYLEQYLYGVVPSEMPESFGQEAAKVQAVCSRSFAYTQWRDSAKYAKFGAHMDNTVDCQVYGTVKETESSIAGVEQTRGQMMLYENEVVTANFFSTSCGVTADAGDVWANAKTEEFPTDTPAYLKGSLQYTEGDYGDLSEETVFYEFITNTEIPSYDMDSPWYRWTTVISIEELAQSMMPVLTEIYQERPYLIKTLVGDTFESQTVDSIGTLKNVYVYSRGTSGIITELLLEGTEKTIKISGENSIRRLFASASPVITLQDGSERSDQTLLPSAFFSIEKGVNSEGTLLQLTLHGGGYGHGVGMSQMGVKGMLNSGFSWDKILKHYYNDIEIGFVPIKG